MGRLQEYLYCVDMGKTQLGFLLAEIRDLTYRRRPGLTHSTLVPRAGPRPLSQLRRKSIGLALPHPYNARH